jgi:hypothetical protein
MRLALKPHPDTPCGASLAIVADVSRPAPDALRLRYEVTGAIAALRLPEPQTPERGHELWLHSCFEAFLRGEGETGYYEINVAPSLQWAAYAFSGYREGMRVAKEIGPPRLSAESGAGTYVLHVALDSLLPHGAWHLGISAVIEERNGSKSYWALAHPPGKPDFHHSDGFIGMLPAERP